MTGVNKNDTRLTLGQWSKRLADGDSTRKGHEFEELIAHELPLIPDCSIEKAWRATDIPPDIKGKFFRGNTANGIDILALKRDGNYIAIQCKCYKSGGRVTARDVSDLAACAHEQGDSHDVVKKDKGVIDKLWVMSTVDVAEATKDWKKGVTFINPIAEWGQHFVGQAEKPAPHKLDALQQAAFDDCIDCLVEKEWTRGKLIMACGTGKTLVSQRVAEHPDITPNGGLVVYATPAILLTGQSQVSWLRNESDRPIASLVVCSDKRAGAGYEKYKSELAYDLLGSVTTSPEKIASEVDRLRRSLPENGVVVIFTTYQSMDKVVEAQQTHGLPAADFAIADEAHWTAGKWSGKEFDEETSKYLMFHRNLNAHRRMYQTATPRIYSQRTYDKFETSTRKISAIFQKQELVDMNSVSIFGGVMHSLSFREALRNQKKGQERLCDYRIVIAADTSIGIPEFALTPDKPTKEEKAAFVNTISEARLCAIMRCMTHLRDYNAKDENEGLRSCIAFANRVHRADGFATKVNDKEMRRHVYGDEDVSLSAGHLNASSKATERMEELGRLAEANEKRDNRHITFNVKVLSEGVDVPALDAVAFIDERDSVIDIVQAVGRVMRRPPGSNKTTGYLIVPVGMGKWAAGEECMAESLAAQQWKILGQVLMALRSIEPNITTDYVERMISIGPGGSTMTREEQREAAREFVKKLMGSDFTGINPHVMPNTGVLPGDLRNDRKSIMQRMVGLGTLHLHAEALGPSLMQCTNTEVSGNSAKAAETAAFRACQAAALHLTLCMLMHQRLVETRANQPPIAKLKSLRECDVRSEIGVNFLEQCEIVLAHDFKPIFNPGIAVLKALRNHDDGKFPKGAVTAMREIADLAASHASKYAEIGADEAGEIFQAAMDTEKQKQFSAHYTLPTAGVLLAEMTCDAYAPKDDPIWRDPQYWRKHAILDPACGSGTLLVAMMSAIVRRARSQGADDDLITALRQALIEDSLTGLDVNKWALQLAATQMAISVGSAPLRRMGLYDMPIEDDNGYPTLGSVELLRLNKDGTSRDLAEAGVKSTPAGIDGTKDIVGAHEDLPDRIKRVDICIANPPFGTPKVRQKDMSRESKRAMRDKKQHIQRYFQFAAGRNPLEGASNSLSPWFTLLMMNTECRVMGKVAPQTALVSTASDEPNYIRHHYDMVECVTSHEIKGKPSWSADSDGTESMLVFKRKNATKDADASTDRNNAPPPPPPNSQALSNAPTYPMQ